MVEKKKTVAELAWHHTSVSPLLWGAGQATTVLRANWGCCGKSSDAILTCNKLMNWTKYEKKGRRQTTGQLRHRLDPFLSCGGSSALLTTPSQGGTLALPHYPPSCPLSPVLLIPLFYIPHFQLIIFLR